MEASEGHVLLTGESTAPVEILVDDTQTDFPRPQFPPGGVEVLPSTSVTPISDNARRRGCAGNDHSLGENSITDLGFRWARCTRARCERLNWTSPGRAFRRARVVRKNWTI